MTHKETFQVRSISMTALMDATLAAIDQLGWKVTGGNAKGTLVTARTPLSIWSSGEKISVSFTQAESGIDVDVRSTINWQLSSWGRNGINVDRLHQTIEHQLFLFPDRQATAVELEGQNAQHEQLAPGSAHVTGYCYKCGTLVTLTVDPKLLGLAETQGPCRSCKAALPPSANYCPSCGLSTDRFCTSCGAQFKSGHLYCGHCGAKITAA